MGREIRITDQAMRDLALLAQWHAAIGSAERARSLLKTLSLAIKNVAFTPLASPVRAETGARERTVAGHTIVYDVETGRNLGPSAGHVTILHISGATLG
jgi:plasmid stabilization system protein ParE